MTESAYEHKLCIPGVACDKVPENAYRISPESDDCEWACNPGYAIVGNQCKKVKWLHKPQDTCQQGDQFLMYEAERSYPIKCVFEHN